MPPTVSHSFLQARNLHDALDAHERFSCARARETERRRRVEGEKLRREKAKHCLAASASCCSSSRVVVAAN